MENEKDVPMIELYKVETALVHESKKSKYAMIVSIVCAVVAVVAIFANIRIVDIFTSKYNARTSDWLETVKVLVNRIPVTEVENANTETMEQLPLP